MNIITTNRPIDLEQFAEEIGSNELVLRTEGDESVITYWGDDLTVEDLQIAVNNHYPKPSTPEPTLEERLVAAQEQLDSYQVLITELQNELQAADPATED